MAETTEEDLSWWMDFAGVINRGGNVTASSNGHREMGEFGYEDDEIEWREKALCRGMDHRVFFPDRGYSMLPAYAICQGCPVRMECLESALDGRDEFGIRAGFTPHERVKIRGKVKAGETLKEAAKPLDDARQRKLIRARKRSQFQAVS